MSTIGITSGLSHNPKHDQAPSLLPVRASANPERPAQPAHITPESATSVW